MYQCVSVCVRTYAFIRKILSNKSYRLSVTSDPLFYDEIDSTRQDLFADGPVLTSVRGE